MTVYISGPYTSGDTAKNVRNAMEAADRLFSAGYYPYIPHLTHFWHLVFPRVWEEWLELDLAWLCKCDCILRLGGTSKGADIEVDEATQRGIPVFHSIDTLILEMRTDFK